MLANTIDITAENLVAEAARMKADGQRLSSLTCVDTGENSVDLFYHFDKDLVITNLKLVHTKTEKVPSISCVYMAAFLSENEIQDQFGVCFDGLIIDYGQTLFLDEEVRTTPFCKYGVSKIVKKGS